jgi:exodeoxyribonuclease-3
MKIATFNVNSIRQRLPIVLDWLVEQEPDILALQETKVVDEDFPVAAFEELGYHVVRHGQKAYNGVATISRHPVSRWQAGFADPTMPEDCRILFTEIDNILVINTYVPNGTKVGTDRFAYKIEWLDRFGRFTQEKLQPDRPVVWLGDINIAPKPEDVYDSKKVLGGVGHHPMEFAALDRVLGWGWQDCFRLFNKEPGHFTYWEFVVPKSVERNIGWRIDHIYASPGLVDRCQRCWIDKAPRLEHKPSDHTPVVAEFDI